MNRRNNQETVELLTPIWQRVLQRSPIGVEDDFFELGGNRSLAAKLFAEIAEKCGRDLRPTMICHAPTIAALAALMEKPLGPPFPTLALLKPGSEEPPVFITPGIGGSIIDFVKLARGMALRNPIYGMEVRGNDGVEEPFETVEDMAQCYLEAIRQVQPGGPYFLIGYSLGGLVVLEVAQRLSARGERIAFLGMLDSYPHPSHLRPDQRFRLSLHQARRAASYAWRAPVRDTISRLVRQIKSRHQFAMVAHAPSADVRVVRSAQLAWARYQPRFYSGRIDFMRAQVVTHFPNDAMAVWAKVAKEIEVETVPGDHLGMVTTRVESLAFALSRRLREALRKEEEHSGMDDERFRMRRQA